MASNAAVAGIQTAGRSGGTGALMNSGITTVVLSSGEQTVDFITFGIHYNGGTNTNPWSYKVYVSKNGGFAFGSVGI